jgi:superfamily II DNA or RNA helicase
MAEMTRRAYEKGRRIIILTHRMELFKSTLAHLGRSGIPCVELNAGADMPPGDWKVCLAMEKTLWNRISKPGYAGQVPDMLIADEIHFQNFGKIIDHYSSAYLIGFSATPKGKHIHKIYTDIVQNVDIPDLIKSGFLTPCKPYQMVDDFSDVKVKGEDFEEKSLFQHFDKSKLYDGIIEEYRDKCNGQKGIVFCVNIEHTVKTYEAFKAAGINAFMVHSGSKNFKMSEEERVRQIQAFEASTDGVMINSGILTTGYDHAAILWVGVMRATLSLPLWLQMQGRGSRIYPGKTHFVTLDFGQNHTRLGLWNQPRTWDIKEPKKKKKLQAAPVKNCPSCGAMLYATIRTCEYCQYEFPVPTFELREGIMCEVSSDIPLGLAGKRVSELSIKELISCQKTGRIKPSYAWRVLRTQEKEFPEKGLLEEYAKQMEYKRGWLYNQQSKIDDETQIGFRDYILRL